MPVSMELRREHRKLSLAIVVALDRSGSMACTVPDGRAKIELADLATAEVLNMLGPMDQFGCIAVDTVPHEIVPLSDVTDASGMRGEDFADRLGGRRNLHLRGAGRRGQMISHAKAGTRHIILFSDAADSRQHRRDYETIVDAVRQGRHHRQRDRPGHRTGLRRRTVEGHCRNAAADSACSRTSPRNCRGCSPKIRSWSLAARS